MADVETEQSQDGPAQEEQTRAREPSTSGGTPGPNGGVEPPPPPPGGPDAIAGVGGTAGNGPALPADPDPELNPATDDELPPEVEEGEDTGTQATKGDAEPGPEQESPA